MNLIYAAALEFQAFCEARIWRHCIIGGLAVIRWGEPRATQDVDITVLTGFEREAEYVDLILSSFAPRVEAPREFALENRVLLVKAGNGIALDVALGGIPFEEEVVRRATPFQYAPEVLLNTCSAEDLVILKSFAAREKDWVDVDGILVRQGEGLDSGYIRKHLSVLAELKGEPEILDEFERRLKRSAQE